MRFHGAAGGGAGRAQVGERLTWDPHKSGLLPARPRSAAGGERARHRRQGGHGRTQQGSAVLAGAGAARGHAGTRAAVPPWHSNQQWQAAHLSCACSSSAASATASSNAALSNRPGAGGRPEERPAKTGVGAGQHEWAGGGPTASQTDCACAAPAYSTGAGEPPRICTLRSAPAPTCLGLGSLDGFQQVAVQLDLQISQ